MLKYYKNMLLFSSFSISIIYCSKREKLALLHKKKGTYENRRYPLNREVCGGTENINIVEGHDLLPHKNKNANYYDEKRRIKEFT